MAGAGREGGFRGREGGREGGFWQGGREGGFCWATAQQLGQGQGGNYGFHHSSHLQEQTGNTRQQTLSLAAAAMCLQICKVQELLCLVTLFDVTAHVCVHAHALQQLTAWTHWHAALHNRHICHADRRQPYIRKTQPFCSARPTGMKRPTTATAVIQIATSSALASPSSNSSGWGGSAAFSTTRRPMRPVGMEGRHHSM